MKKANHPIHNATMLVLFIVLACAGITTIIKLANSDHYSPVRSHVEYILSKHNDSCKYEIGKCPESLCSHSAIQ